MKMLADQAELPYETVKKLLGLSSETVREDIHSLTVSHKGDKGWRD